MRHSVLVTGAFGNIGSRIAGLLAGEGHRVTAVDLPTRGTKAAAARFDGAVEAVWSDICDPTLWPRALEGIDTVIHMAAMIPPGTNQHPDRAIAVNQTATVELVQAMERSATAKRLIFASSMAVAGHEQHRRTPPLSVEEGTHPTDLYGRTKAESERRIRESSLRWSILRLAVCPPIAVSLEYARKFDTIFDASADGRMELVHNDDAALAFSRAMDCNEAVGKILYIGGGRRCQSRVLDFTNGVFTTMGLNPLPAKVFRPGPTYFFGDWLDTSESEKLLGYQQHGIDDILTEMRAELGWRRWLVRAIAPVASPILERLSPHKTST